MSLANVWERALVYFGIADDEDWDEDAYYEDEAEPDPYERRNVRHLPARRSRRDYDDDWTDPEPSPDLQRTSVLRPRLSEQRRPGRTNLEAVRGTGTSQVHLVLPRSFNDAQQVADRYKNGVPVILNLQSADAELSKRLIDFASGLTYALDGGMQRIADKVFLLTPRDVELSAEDRARMLERGFFNQA
ncbi:MAG: cell division inhibitor SepF [Gaiellaceae bacterium]|jgi:cell division inhibitor SepF|nr:cell division inhibitor SepF [Gaiellaceae bacterium]